jgi:outer membrane protein TolC
MHKKNHKRNFILGKSATIFSLLTVFIILPVSTYSTTEETPYMELTLQDAIKNALGENLDIKFAEIDPEIRIAEVHENQGRFDPQLSFENTLRYKEEQTATALAGAQINENRNYNSSLGARQQLRTGATYEINFYNDRNSTNSAFVRLDPHFASELIFDIEQPLFKNRGASIQEAQINIAKNTYKSSLLELNSEKSIVVTDVEKKYWDLYNAYDELDVAKLALRLAQTLYEVSKARIEAGVLAPVELLVSEAEIASRERDLIDAEKNIGDFDDQLKAAMNYNRWDVQLIPVDRPRAFGESPDLNKEIAEALEQRMDFKQALLSKDSQEISVNFAKVITIQ